MPVKVLVGNLFESKAQTLVNTVNCVGVMGKGIALEFKKQYPEMYEDYVRRCEQGQVKLGRPYLYRGLFSPWILNFPTKDHWRSVASLDHIVDGLQFLVDHYEEWGITSLAVPPLGAGNGQLEWSVVGPTLIEYLEKLDIPVELYAPHDVPDDEIDPRIAEGINSTTAKWISPAWVALVKVTDELGKQAGSPAIGRTMFQKIAYIASLKGLPTGLQFTRGSYGPHSRNYKRMLTRLVNNGILREQRAGTLIQASAGPTFEDAVRKFTDDIEGWDVEIDQLVDLFMRIEDSNHAELVASVMMVSSELKSKSGCRPSEREIFDEVMDWKIRRRPPVDEVLLGLTIEDLNALGWIDAVPSTNLPISEELQFAD